MDDPIIERAGEIEEDREPLEGDDGEDERQDTPPLEDNL